MSLCPAFSSHLPLQLWWCSTGRPSNTGCPLDLWMLHCLLQSWLVSLFLDCPASLGIRCPNSTEVEVREVFIISAAQVQRHGAAA